MVWLSLAIACSRSSGDHDPAGSPTAETGLTGEGRLSLLFAIDPGYVPLMDEPPVGKFWGSLFDAADVSSIGPNPGASPWLPVTVERLTLPIDGTPTALLASIDAIPAGGVAILGFVDSDNNADPAAPLPDHNDPVTLPFENEFVVKPDANNVARVYFGLLYP